MSDVDKLNVASVQSGDSLTVTMLPARVESTTPVAYRLARKPDGEVVMQGKYVWHEGFHYGHEWRDIPTVDVDDRSQCEENV